MLPQTSGRKNSWFMPQTDYHSSQQLLWLFQHIMSCYFNQRMTRSSSSSYLTKSGAFLLLLGERMLTKCTTKDYMHGVWRTVAQQNYISRSNVTAEYTNWKQLKHISFVAQALAIKIVQTICIIYWLHKC